MKPIAIAATFLLSSLLSAAAHAATLRTVALTGQQAPGKPDGTIFTSFSVYRPVVLNDAGQTAFRAVTSDALFGYGIWSEGGGSLDLVAAAGQQAPGLPDGATYGDLDFPQHQVINDAGSTAFAGHSTGGLGFWSSGAGGSALIARSGEQAAGTPAGVVYAFNNSENGSSLVMNDAGQTAFFAGLAGPGVDLFTNGRGVWAQRHGGLELVARTGNHAPGTADGVNFGDIFLRGGPALNGLGQTAFPAYLTGPGVDSTNASGIWSEGSGSLALVARTGNQAPGMPDGAVFTGLNSLGSIAFNNAGQTAFSGSVTGGGVDSTNNTGIWSEASGSLALAVRSGTPAPGTPSGVNFGYLALTTPPALNDAGQIAFQAELTGGGVNSTNEFGFWSGAPGSPALVAREGDHAPGTEDGVVFRDFRFASNLSPLILNAAGQTAFVARLTGSGIIASNDFGIWATDRSGALQLIARKGNSLEVAPGDFRTISILTFRADPNNLSTGNSDGHPSFFNNLGQLAFLAGFTDGSAGVFVSNRVAVPEPSAISTILMGTLCLNFHRRRNRS
jgi:hypothetical protein